MAARPRENDVPGSRARSAKRISFWTTNLVASAFVLIVALVVGRELTSWWRPPGTAVENPPPWVMEQGDHAEILFGEIDHAISWSEHRGDAESALAALQAVCLDDAQQSAPSVGQLPPAGPHEQRLLARLTEQQPELAIDNGIAVHRWEVGFPMIVATAPVMPAARHAADGDSDTNHGETAARVVTWGLAVPYEENTWRLWSLRPRTSSANRSQTNGIDLPLLPSGAEHVMTIRQPDRSTVTVFRGDRADQAVVDEWIEFFGGSLMEANDAKDWTRTGDRWTYSRATSDGRGQVNIVLSLNRQQRVVHGAMVINERAGTNN